MTCFFFLSLVLVFCPKFLFFTPQQRCQVQAPSRMAKELRWWLCVLTSHWWPFACVSSEPFLSFSSCFLAHVHHTFRKGCILDILVGTWFDDVQSTMIYIRMLIKFRLVSMLERKLVKRQKNKAPITPLVRRQSRKLEFLLVTSRSCVDVNSVLVGHSP